MYFKTLTQHVKHVMLFSRDDIVAHRKYIYCDLHGQIKSFYIRYILANKTPWNIGTPYVQSSCFMSDTLFLIGHAIDEPQLIHLYIQVTINHLKYRL